MYLDKDSSLVYYSEMDVLDLIDKYVDKNFIDGLSLHLKSSSNYTSKEIHLLGRLAMAFKQYISNMVIADAGVTRDINGITIDKFVDSFDDYNDSKFGTILRSTAYCVNECQTYRKIIMAEEHAFKPYKVMFDSTRQKITVYTCNIAEEYYVIRYGVVKASDDVPLKDHAFVKVMRHEKAYPEGITTKLVAYDPENNITLSDVSRVFSESIESIRSKHGFVVFDAQ
jgi:hypothetical protein